MSIAAAASEPRPFPAAPLGALQNSPPSIIAREKIDQPPALYSGMRPIGRVPPLRKRPVKPASVLLLSAALHVLQTKLETFFPIGQRDTELTA